MLDAANIGKIFLDYQYKQCEIAGIIENFNGRPVYQINEDYPAPYKGYGVIWDQGTFEKMEAAQEDIQQSKIKSEQREKERQQKEEQERIKQIEKENLFGFTQNKTPLQAGKILKTLMKESLYKTDSGNVRLMTRKQFIIEKLSQAFTPEPYSYKDYKKVTKYYYGTASREYEEYIKSGYRLKKDVTDNTYDSWEINKTEYEFAVYYQDYMKKSA